MKNEDIWTITYFVVKSNPDFFIRYYERNKIYK